LRTPLSTPFPYTTLFRSVPAQTKLNIQLREKPVELNNQTIAQKYGRSSAPSRAASVSNPYSWLIAHPLPNARVSSNYGGRTMGRSEEHTSELQSRENLVC